MGRGFLSILLITASMLAVGEDRVWASKRTSSKREKAKTGKSAARSIKARRPAKQVARKNEAQSLDDQFEHLKKLFGSGKITRGKFWNELVAIEEKKNKLTKGNRASLGQVQASMLMADDYPVLAALYAADVLRQVSNPLKEEYRKSWYVLAKVHQRRSLQDVVEALAGDLKLGAKVPPTFGTDWFYYEGNAEINQNHPKAGLTNYQRLKIDDRHYMTAKYQSALVHLENEDYKRAELALKSMVNAASYTKAPITDEKKRELANYAKIALARLYYQQQKFKNSIAFYRAVDRDSEHFYDALFEQSWAFFMAGYPNHSLGALHAVESPFYKDVFNPEAAMLRSIIYFWMCRYDDARSALADFTDRHADDVEALTEYLDRRRLSAEDAYTLFENHVSGVSSRSLGISRQILETAATEDAMLLVRDQIAYTVYELDRLQSKGIHGVRKNPAAHRLLKQRVAKLEKKVGEQFLVELRSLKDDFDQLYEQAQFLYIELLMSEKEQLLGRELHASSKIDKVTRRKKIIGWANDAQSWSDSMKNEFWWDEVGFYIYDVKPLCKAVR